MPLSGEITALLGAWQQGDPRAESRLMSLIYKDLHARAQLYMRRERRDHTLQPTALVHETYLRLMREGGDYHSRAHFLAAASIVMRRVLVDHARERAAAKRTGDKQRVELNDVLAAENPRVEDMLVLDEALTQLAACDARQARVVELLFFGGLTEEEAATTLGVSSRTVKRDYRSARAWLQTQFNRKSS
jgi:RNA polymerase sigma factor (TIGR02999 family)